MNLMHALTNSILGQGVLSNSAQNAVHNSMLGSDRAVKKSSQTVFNGRINVEKVANGYIINIAVR
jgi:hypothetical protein